LRKIISLTALVAAFALAVPAALAVVTFDPDTVEEEGGFVGKGDVQNALGLKNADMQTHHTHIQFKYVESEAVEQDCETTGAPPKTVTGVRTKTTAVESQIASSSRQKNQYVGWDLTGLGETTDESTEWTGPNGETSGNACPSGSSPSGAVRTVGDAVAALIAYDDQGHYSEVVIWTPSGS
jgi:hypothetical protein